MGLAHTLSNPDLLLSSYQQLLCIPQPLRFCCVSPMISLTGWWSDIHHKLDISQGAIAHDTKKPGTSCQTSVALRAKAQHARLVPVLFLSVKTPKLELWERL